jgi:hypothetical protein
VPDNQIFILVIKKPEANASGFLWFFFWKKPDGDSFFHLIEYLNQLVFGYHPRLSPLELAFVEKHQSGHALHPIILGQSRIFVHINFNNPNAVAHLSGEILQNGRHRLAGPAPGSEKIHQHGRGALDEVLEILFR